MMGVDTGIRWDEVYHPDDKTGKKFETLPRPIRFTADYQQNIEECLDWLVRAGRQRKIRERQEPTVYRARDQWYEYQLTEGVYFHVCFPRDMLGFRQRYEGLFTNMEHYKELRIQGLRIKEVRQQLWNAWNCIGADGNTRVQVKTGKLYSPQDEELVIDKSESAFSAWGDNKNYKQVWANKCSRCSTPLPGALRASIVMKIKLKGIV